MSGYLFDVRQYQLINEAEYAFSNGRLSTEDFESTLFEDDRRAYGVLADDADVQTLLRAGACASGIVTYVGARGVEGGLAHAMRTWRCYQEWAEQALDHSFELPEDLVAALSELEREEEEV